MTLSYRVTHLRTGFNHQFKVQAVNAVGSSELSASSTAILTALVPTVPTGLTLVSRSDEKLTFTWN